jgi:hypothetical protein
MSVLEKQTKKLSNIFAYDVSFPEKLWGVFFSYICIILAYERDMINNLFCGELHSKCRR